ncbi:unnamed protein product [Prorocentrum cordatum]|uniref:Voltage-gated hydrogen channel 1 n=1 Tax=Prorocentrum cordatum TaxID=2364126 RepID=A0ABN9QYG1_9DINO|nr:unnamed protein product [Polarella glacialis]
MAELVGFGPSGSGVTPQGAPRDAGSLADNVSRTSSQPDLVSERIWWSEAMLSTIQNIRGTTRQLQASFVEESQKQQALAAQVQRLLAEHPQQLRGGAAEEAQENHDEAQLDEVAWGGRLAELLEREMEERRAGEACLLEKVQHHGDALARIEALIGPGASQDVDSVAESAAEEDCATRPPLEKSSTVGLSVRVSSALFEEDGSSTHSRCRMMAHQRRRFAVCTSCLIVANSIFLGLEANATITSSGLTTPDGIAWRLANAFFALAFLVELIVRWVSDGAAFFLLPRNPDCFWNWMDTLLILITVIEEILHGAVADILQSTSLPLVSCVYLACSG